MKRRLKRLVLVPIWGIVLLALLSCGTGKYPHALRMGDWIGHGFSEEQREELRSFFEESVRDGSVAGCALLVIHENEVIFREAFGMADMETGRAFTTENPCFIASTTKPVTSTVLVMLDEGGVLSLDDPVEKWIPSFEGISVRGQETPARPPRVWEGLSHRSGLPGNADLDRGFREFDGSLADAVDRLAGEGLMAEPGTRWAYGRAGFMTAARVAEVAKDKHFEVLMQEMLLDPLGMASTTFHPGGETIGQMPRMYGRVDGELRPRTRMFQETVVGDLINPGGGLVSTLDDMGRFLLFHMNRGKARRRRLVSAEALSRMYRIPEELPGNAYGLGWNVLESGVLHIGASGTMVWIDFGKELAGVLLTQTAWRGNPRFQRRWDETLRSVFEEE